MFNTGNTEKLRSTNECQNPWVGLPRKEPFVLAEDKPNMPSPPYHLEVLPIPYLGYPETAEVYLLNANLGFKHQDLELRNNPYYVKQKRRSLMHKSDYEFFLLDPKFKDTFGYEWWDDRLWEVFDQLEKEGYSSKSISC